MNGTLFETSLRTASIDLRQYQHEAIDAILDRFDSGDRSTLLVLPTGTGKTVTFGALARHFIERDERVLVLAHRGELIDQAAETLGRLGIDAGVEKAESYARATFEPQAVIATVQTLQRRRLESWPRDHFGLVIVDEAHHATAETYRNILKYFDSKVLGVTATADRADGTLLGEVFDSLAYEVRLWDAMTDRLPGGPFLSRLKFVQCELGIDLREIRTTAGDLNQADLEEAIRPHIEGLANAIRQEVGDRKTLVFTPDVGSATALASAFKCLNLSSEWVSGDRPDRSDIVHRFKQGDFQVLTNCALLLEGFDCPDIGAIALCRPTKSRPLLAQMVGRGTRLASGKTDCLVIDFDWLTRKHDLVKPVELFDAETDDPEIVEIAKRMAESGETLDLCDLIEQAKEEKTRRTEYRIRARQRELKYRRTVYDPAEVADIIGVPWRNEAMRYEGTITGKQLSALTKFTKGKMDGLNRLSKRRASTLMDAFVKRSRANLATYSQVVYLIKNGVDPTEARAMTIAEASSRLDEIFGNGRKGGVAAAC